MRFKALSAERSDMIAKVMRSLMALMTFWFVYPNARATTVSLAWDPSPDTVAGYRLYSGISGTLLATTDVGLATNAIVADLVSGQQYLFYATAYDTNGVESEPSNQVLFLAGGTQPTNRPPTLAPIPNQSVDVGTLLQFSLSASDPDTGQMLSYTMSNAPVGAVLNITTGLFSWTPTAAQAPTTNSLTVTVTDNGVPALSTNQSFQIVVRDGYLLSVTNSPYGTVQISPLGSLNAQGTKYISGTTVTATAIPANGYKFSHWLLDGGSYAQNPLSFTMTKNRVLVPYYTRGSRLY